jgi:hypothetical protein
MATSTGLLATATRLKAGLDIIVTPPSLEWTVFTHEEPVFGPYFATR